MVYFAYIYHEFQPNVGKDILAPWILCESTRMCQWDFNVMGKACFFSDHAKNVGFQAPIFGHKQLFNSSIFVPSQLSVRKSAYLIELHSCKLT